MLEHTLVNQLDMNPVSMELWVEQGKQIFLQGGAVKEAEEHITMGIPIVWGSGNTFLPVSHDGSNVSLWVTGLSLSTPSITHKLQISHSSRRTLVSSQKTSLKLLSLKTEDSGSPYSQVAMSKTSPVSVQVCHLMRLTADHCRNLPVPPYSALGIEPHMCFDKDNHK